ncbi:hypothetical protein RCL_jg19267.t1 [Rhizophagus clarus]|uniref:Uncharacterized protein n=1 Tax=Rhizophagus clarus TaxID=94130 RepID=A0A8H3QZM1_9GLOM|nr:hypothetical protein RCL_jg19267.t1 [Rhizophagus clarus]
MNIVLGYYCLGTWLDARYFHELSLAQLDIFELHILRRDLQNNNSIFWGRICLYLESFSPLLFEIRYSPDPAAFYTFFSNEEGWRSPVIRIIVVL